MTFDLPTRRKLIHYLWLGYSIRWIVAQLFAPSKSSVSIWVQHYLATGLYTTPAQGHRVRPGKMLRRHVLFSIDFIKIMDPTLY